MTDTSFPLRIGIVGAGTICREAHLPVLANVPEAEVAFVADVDRTNARRTTRGYDVTALEISEPSELPSCDVALLAVPVGVRKPYLEEFGRRGTAMFVEKPFAPDEATHREFLDAAGGAPMTCNYTRLWFGVTQQLRALVASKLLGELQRVELSHDLVGPTNVSPGSYKLDPELSGGGILVETGCHAISQLLYVLDGYELRADSAEFVWTDGLDVEVDARLRAVSDVDAGDAGSVSVPVHLTLSRVTPCGTDALFVFDNATVTFDPVSADARATVQLPENTESSELAFAPDDACATSFLQGFTREWTTFLRGVADGSWGADRRERETGLSVTRAISAVYGSETVTEEVGVA